MNALVDITKDPADLFAPKFHRPASFYKRNRKPLVVLEHYVNQAAYYLSKTKDISIEEAQAFIKAGLAKGGQFEFKDPKVEYLQRKENGDREKRETTLTRYIASAIKNDELIAPTFTTYLPPKVKTSVLARFVVNNIALRSAAKKEQFKFEAIKDFVNMGIKKVEQTGRKLGNNGISGAHNSSSTILFNKTAHSTLTSTCRSTSGYGNANNEKFITGNRHYYDADVVMNNIASIVTNVDYEKIKLAVDRFGLKLPSCEDVMDCITYSSSLYWWDQEGLIEIRKFVAKLNPYERAAFVYVGDLYHLMRHNEDFVRQMLIDLCKVVKGDLEKPEAMLAKCPEDYLFFTHQLCRSFMRGVGKDYTKISHEDRCTLALTTRQLALTVIDYQPLIEAFWITPNIPASVAYFPTSIRRSALTSDTDSTIFTVQDWVTWFMGKPTLQGMGHPVYCAVVFLASETITHVLATMSANFGVGEDLIFKIAMKSEFSFDVFVPTMIGKHYYAGISCQEGNVKPELEYETKGVGLKDSTVPKSILDVGERMRKYVIHQAYDGELIDLRHLLDLTADTELEIINSLKRGERKYLRAGTIKDQEAYSTDPDRSPYAHHVLWNEVFGPKYGMMGEPPYATLKVSVNTDTPRKFKAWIESINDLELRGRLIRYCERVGKTQIGTFMMPSERLAQIGFPDEIRRIVRYEHVACELCNPLYLVLESVGYFCVKEKVVRMPCMNGFGTIEVVH